MAEHSLGELATAVVDREAVDWPAAAGAAGSPEARAAVDGLRCLARLTSVSSVASPAKAPSYRRLPPLLEFGLGFGAFVTTVAILGLVASAASVRDSVQLILALHLVTFGATAFYLLKGGRSDRRLRALAGFYLAVAACFSNAGLPEPGPSGLGVLGAVLQALRPESFLPAFLWQFARDFPRGVKFSALDRLASPVVKALSWLGVILVSANLLSAAGWLPASLASWLVRDVEEGRGFFALVFAFTVPALGLIAVRARSVGDSELRRVRLFLGSVVFGMGPAAVVVSIESMAPAMAVWFDQTVGHTAMRALVWGPLLTMPIAAGYAVSVSRVLELRETVRLGLRYLVVRWVIDKSVWIAALPLLLLLYGGRERPLVETLASLAARPWLVLGAIGVVFWCTKSWLVRFVDQWLMAAQADPARELAEMNERLGTARTPIELGQVVALASERAFQAHATLLLRTTAGRFVPVDGRSDPWPAETLLPVLLGSGTGPCRIEAGVRSSFYELLSAGDRAWIDKTGASVACLLQGPDGEEAIGALVLGHRRNAGGYSSVDLDWLGAATASVRLASQATGAQTSASRMSVLGDLAAQCRSCLAIHPWDDARPVCACGAALTPAALPAVVLGRYELQQLLGVGGMGVVYLARDRELERSVALKTLIQVSPHSVERLRVEARTMAGLAHPHLATLHGMELWRGSPLLFVEYLPGGSLATRLRSGPVSRGEARRVFEQVLDALDHLHRRQLIHGDIKPSNIGFATDDTVKVLDFGLARTIAASEGDDTGARPEWWGGTVAYLPPDVMSGAGPMADADLWAIAVVAFEMWSGHHPFLLPDGHLDHASAGRFAANVPLLAAFVSGSLHLDRRRRPATVAELRAIAEATIYQLPDGTGPGGCVE